MNYKYAFLHHATRFRNHRYGVTNCIAPGKAPDPADGHEIHVLAPHKMDGKVMGPYHHYCKAVSNDVLECLIYESTEPNALLKQVNTSLPKMSRVRTFPSKTGTGFIMTTRSRLPLARSGPRPVA